MYVNVRYVSTVRSVRSVTKAFTFIVSIGASWWLRLGGKEVAKEHIFFAKIYEILWVLHSIATYCYPRPLPDYRFCDAVSHVFNFSFVTTFLKLQKSLQHIVSMVEAAMLLRLKNSRWTWWTGVWALKKKSFASGIVSTLYGLQDDVYSSVRHDQIFDCHFCTTKQFSVAFFAHSDVRKGFHLM